MRLLGTGGGGGILVSPPPCTLFNSDRACYREGVRRRGQMPKNAIRQCSSQEWSREEPTVRLLPRNLAKNRRLPRGSSAFPVFAVLCVPAFRADCPDGNALFGVC